MILTPEMLREVAKDIDIVAASHLGRQNVKGLLLASAYELERLADVAQKMADSIGVSGSEVTYVESEVEPPTEKEMAKEMAPTLKGKKSRK